MKTVRSISINWCLFFILLVFGVGSGQAANRDEIIFFFNDAAGSAVAAVNEAGEVCWSEVYTPYGDKTVNDDLFSPTGCGIVGEERGFTGHTEDVNSDLVYMQQRYYDPSIGRFLSIDPIDSNPNQPMTFNRYAYGNNNPYKYVDPDGRNPLLLLATPPGQAAVVTGLNAAGAVATAVSGFYAIQIAGRLQGKIFGELVINTDSSEEGDPESGEPNVKEHPSKRAARKAAQREAGMGIHGESEELPETKFSLGSRPSDQQAGNRQTTRSVDTGGVVHHDPWGHLYSDGSTMNPHYGAETSSGTTHHTYPSAHDPATNH